MLPLPDASASQPRAQQSLDRYKTAPIAAGPRHIGFGQRLRGWLARLSRPRDPWPRAAPPRPETSVADAGVADTASTVVAAEPVALTQPVTLAAATFEEPPAVVPVPRGRRTIRLDPARDDSEWRWSSASSA